MCRINTLGAEAINGRRLATDIFQIDFAVCELLYIYSNLTLLSRFTSDNFLKRWLYEEATTY